MINSFVLASLAPLTKQDQEADLIIEDRPMKFIQLIGMNGSIDQMMLDAEEITDVLVLHLGTIQKLHDVMEGK
ncbi:hypothetical protein ASC84_04690 [Acinetobacter sp. Root1280]|uniref:hypothetical protein n=1 Tax=Acinetobacter sp. Root1280 TaxID=1736444 RepID=UPI0006F8E6E3|nr:hypothetical protein [Acinetobacter sp. Root1280]KQW98054.1 hypothetical protein ASC84_04690 [Acinetobacter sp. Root1280]